ncbi:SMP-30/gluconolactonase/LRE family protein [Sulfitobacter sp. D35]|uniref:SMP-30/gluconolactonase/LRE family protein n=1 Tax=Sulfitobacter sp. D35 TaxID=3083252 RepID=UPI00296E997E|nr:SMP-30/gluconolactonase/LRE family protein [Sulfitobacter sp. D35]MDW4499362.1 SMP-30/gluconolactonase/LRE family protein [Sulfitobacter sp. D35]
MTLTVDARDIVGESLVWDDRKGCLFWVDIIGRRLHRFDSANGRHETYPTPGRVTSIGLRADGGAIVGLERRVTLWDYTEGFETLAEVEPESPENRLNEGVVGPDGAFWVGTMQNNIARDDAPKDITASTGALYRVTADGAVDAVCDDRFGITNTMVWTDDGRFITADTLQNTLYSYAIDAKTGMLSDRRTIVSGFERGLPDGSCLDAEGFIWNCRVVGGHCVARFAPDGRLDRIVELPCSWPTSCAFGGAGLSTLYVTSARFTMDADHLAAHPEEGGLFALTPGVRGLPCHRFGG